MSMSCFTLGPTLRTVMSARQNEPFSRVVGGNECGGQFYLRCRWFCKMDRGEARPNELIEAKVNEHCINQRSVNLKHQSNAQAGKKSKNGSMRT